MINVKNAAFNDKGNLRPAVRDAVAKYVADHQDVFGDAVKVEGKNTFVLPVQDIEGNTFYVNFDYSVSAMSAADRAPRKTKVKVNDEVIVVE